MIQFLGWIAVGALEIQVTGKSSQSKSKSYLSITPGHNTAIFRLKEVSLKHQLGFFVFHFYNFKLFWNLPPAPVNKQFQWGKLLDFVDLFCSNKNSHKNKHIFKDNVTEKVVYLCMCYLCIGRKQVKSKQFLLSSSLLRETSLSFRVGETVFDF